MTLAFKRAERIVMVRTRRHRTHGLGPVRAVSDGRRKPTQRVTTGEDEDHANRATSAPRPSPPAVVYPLMLGNDVDPRTD